MPFLTIYLFLLTLYSPLVLTFFPTPPISIYPSKVCVPTPHCRKVLTLLSNRARLRQGHISKILHNYFFLLAIPTSDDNGTRNLGCDVVEEYQWRMLETSRDFLWLSLVLGKKWRRSVVPRTPSRRHTLPCAPRHRYQPPHQRFSPEFGPFLSVSDWIFRY